MLFEDGPRFLIRDTHRKFRHVFDSVATGGGTTIVKMPPAAPNCHGVCERFLGSVRRECLGPILIISEKHLRPILREFVDHFNKSRPITDWPSELALWSWNSKRPPFTEIQETSLKSLSLVGFTMNIAWRRDHGWTK